MLVHKTMPLLGQPEGHGLLGAWLPQWWQLGGVWRPGPEDAASWDPPPQLDRALVGGPGWGLCQHSGGLICRGPLPLRRAWASGGESWAWWPCPFLSEQRITFGEGLWEHCDQLQEHRIWHLEVCNSSPRPSLTFRMKGFSFQGVRGF